MTWDLTIDDWLVMSRYNRVEKDLLSRNQYEANRFARIVYQAWTIDGIPPEEQRDRRPPNLSTKARLRKHKQLRASGTYPGA